MKKFFFPLLAVVLAVTSCDLKNHFSFEEIEFDYPASWTVIGKDVDGDLMTTMLSDPDDDFGSIFFEITKENAESTADAEPEVLESYLRKRALDVAEGFLPEDADLEDAPEDEDDFVYLDEAESWPEAASYFDGTNKGKPYYACVRSVMYDGRYTIIIYAAASSEEKLDEILEKSFYTLHEK